MNKKILFTLAIIVIAYFSKAQTWGTYGIGLNASLNGVNGVITYNGNVFATGDFSKAGGNPAKCIAQWNGTVWSPVGTGLNAGGWGYGMCVYNSNLYVGGLFDSAGGVSANFIAEWNGTNWSPLGSGMGTTTTGAVRSLCVYGGQLIAGGWFDTAGGIPVSNIAAWNGTSWSALGLGIEDSVEPMVAALVEYNGELYAGGYFDSAGGAPASNIAKWNGTSWSPVGGGIRGKAGTWSTMVCALCVYEGNLYAGGVFDTAGSVVADNIAMWDGTTWSAVGGGIGTVGSAEVFSLTTNNSTLYAGGIMNIAGSYSVKNVAQWNGSFWYPMGSGINTGYVIALCMDDSAVVAVGEFTQAGSTSCNDIAYWVGAPPSPINICYVTVDTSSQYNEILWDKTGIDTNLVDSFRVYVKSFSTYKYLGSVSVHNFTQFVDSTSQPNSFSSTYEICSVDTNTLVSLLTSTYHQTILLQANVGLGNVVNLTWNPYVGDSVYYYLILRDSTGMGNWQRLDSVPNNIYAYTDNHPPVTSHLRYIVNTVWNLNCVPYSNSPIVRHQIMSTNTVTSRSNRKELIITGIQNINSMPSVTIYPNPSKDLVTITLSQPTVAIITLNDVLGQTIYTDRLSGNENVKQLNLSGIRDGVYFLKLSLNNGGELVRKIEVVR